MFQLITRGRDTIATIEIPVRGGNSQTQEVAQWQPGRNDINGQGTVTMPRTQRVVVVWGRTSWDVLVDELYGASDRPELELAVGDRVRVVDDWRDGGITAAQGREGVLGHIAPDPDATLPYEVTLDGDEFVTIVAAVERV